MKSVQIRTFFWSKFGHFSRSVCNTLVHLNSGQNWEYFTILDELLSRDLPLKQISEGADMSKLTWFDYSINHLTVGVN